MPDVKALNPGQRQKARESLAARYRDFQSLKMNLDMTRGKPCPEQLDLSAGLLDCLTRAEFKAADGSDCRNYGGLDGLPEAKALFAAYMGVRPEEIIIGGSSSLTLMHDAMNWAVLFGAGKGSTPWGVAAAGQVPLPQPRLRPPLRHLRAPGDRDGPGRLARGWPGHGRGRTDGGRGCVRQGHLVRAEVQQPHRATCTRTRWCSVWPPCAPRPRTSASSGTMRTRVHHLGTGPAPLADILEACRRAGHPERAFLFGSTSKISFAGSGLAFMAGSTATMEWAKGHLGFQTIGPDKLNQLRHVRFFIDPAGIERHMQRHAAILQPKFDAVQEVLGRDLSGKGVAAWTRPAGGYFTSVDTWDGCARRVIQLAAEAGVKLTPAGSTYPYKLDPRDRNIRIAPSFPPLADIRRAMEVLAVCIERVSLEKKG